ncbi:MAG TPA: nitronate monooxygenase, partial [Nevskiaceae bacterium]|nr:nitronate monooxygenase [Nevskiaceae bacterium]
MSKNFDVLGLVAADLEPTLARALLRGGATAILDLEQVRDEAAAMRNFAGLLSSQHGALGLRVTPARSALARDLLAAAGARPMVVIACGDFASVAEQLAPTAQVRMLAEITAASQLANVPASFQGLVALGHEGGGWVGEDTSFILLQKLAGKTSLPVYARGSVGVHSAAACRVAGAAGVVLDEQLLLLDESPLPEPLKSELARLNGAECRLFGELLEAPCRAYARAGSAVLKAAEEDLRQAEGGQLPLAEWKARLASRMGWNGDGSQLLPIGQGIGLAAAYRTQFGSAAKLIRAVRRAAMKQVELAAQQQALGENAPLAASHGTRYPLVQGPMTRVSDSADFAAAVARGGALPLLALALMRGPQVARMLADTKARIGSLPWGVGMLGFVPHALREEQCAEIWKCKPDFALIAGGRPDQAAEFEKRGITTYIHAPAPALLRLYLEQGARRFVFEGRECGGHVGPLASFALWEQMIEVLLAEVKPGEESQVHVLFAGGIHDALSAAMVAAMTAPLTARGIKVGALMGTAYLFTEEIVSSGAVVAGFQKQALGCERTMNLETGPGHASRCVDTRFAHEFYETRRRLIGEGKSAEEIRDTLEDLNLGRLRIASKGVNRDADGKIVDVAPPEQLAAGMYMIGQVATLRHATQTIEQLHDHVCRGAAEHLSQLLEPQIGAPKPSDIAIVGIGTL